MKRIGRVDRGLWKEWWPQVYLDIFLAARVREKVLAFMFQPCKLTMGICLVSCSYDLILCNIWAPTWWKAQRGRPLLQSCGMMLLLAVAESILPGSRWGCQRVPLFLFTVVFFMFFSLPLKGKKQISVLAATLWQLSLKVTGKINGKMILVRITHLRWAAINSLTL